MGAPPPADGRSLLDEVTGLTARARREARDQASARNFLVWGIAWLVGYLGLDLLPPPANWAAATIALVAASAFSWFPHRQGVRSGWSGRTRLGWLVVLGCSPAVVATVGPLDTTRLMLLVGALWALAMALFAVATRDPVVVVVMVLATLAAGVAASQDLLPSLALFGVVAGGLLVLVGATRLWTLHRSGPRVGPGAEVAG